MNYEKKPTVALIYGGRGRERDVSLKGKDHVLPLIDENAYDRLLVEIMPDGRWTVGNREVYAVRGGFYSPEDGELFKADRAFPLLHGDMGEDGVVQGALECVDMPYVGCDVSAGAICRDKGFVKTIASSLDIPTLPFLTLLKSEGVECAVRRAEASLSYPMFIKPARLGSSIGAVRADTRGELLSALSIAFSLCSRVIAEPYLYPKRELECAYLSVKGKELFTYPGEILLDGVYGYKEKYLSSDVGLSVRADVDLGVGEQVREYSRRLVHALGVRDLSRVDFFLSGDRLYFNEINTMPGFTEGSLYPKMIEAAGYTPRELIGLLIEGCVHR